MEKNYEEGRVSTYWGMDGKEEFSKFEFVKGNLYKVFPDVASNGYGGYILIRKLPGCYAKAEKVVLDPIGEDSGYYKVIPTKEYFEIRIMGQQKMLVKTNVKKNSIVKL